MTSALFVPYQNSVSKKLEGYSFLRILQSPNTGWIIGTKKTPKHNFSYKSIGFPFSSSFIDFQAAKVFSSPQRGGPVQARKHLCSLKINQTWEKGDLCGLKTPLWPENQWNLRKGDLCGLENTYGPRKSMKLEKRGTFVAWKSMKI